MKQAYQRSFLLKIIIKAVGLLADMAMDANDACEEPDERGRCNDAIGLIIHEDGSGRVATFGPPLIDNEPFSNGYVVSDFKSPDELINIFAGQISPRSDNIPFMEWRKTAEATPEQGESLLIRVVIAGHVDFFLATYKGVGQYRIETQAALTDSGYHMKFTSSTHETFVTHWAYITEPKADE